MKKQCGAALLLVVMILIVLSTMIFFNARITAYEQIISGNDRRSKLATHAAEAGISHAKKYLTRNIRDMTSTGDTGWLPGATGADRHWLPCKGEDAAMMPCASAPDVGRSFVRDNLFYYVEDIAGTVDEGTPEECIYGSFDTCLPLSALLTELDGEAVSVDLYRVQALLCAIDFDQEKPEIPPTCSADGNPTGINVAIQLVSTGYADANQTAEKGGAEAIITQVVASVEPGGGPPAVPLMSYNEVELSGTYSVVAAPNGGGIGVPVSIWSKSPVDITGSASTCELEEYLELDTRTDDWIDETTGKIVCASCKCPDKGSLSNKTREYFDIVDNDPDYPEDIFEYYFGVARTEWMVVMDSADVIAENCVGDVSGWYGLVWVTGYCDLKESQYGSVTNPVVVVTAGGAKLNAGTEFYGVLVLTDPTKSTQDQIDGTETINVTLNGGPTVYGAILNDPSAPNLAGNFSVVYVEEILKKILPLIILGDIPGGWSDQSTFN